MVAGGLLLVALGFALDKAEPLGAAIAVCTATPLILGMARSRSYARALPRG
jgi:hypothetical protein